jgi:spore coat polysaccharide biosynthesis protein SpsF (cytidylyltransferase family)
MANTVAIIQARMTSSRLPGKVLADLGGKPLIERMIARVRRTRTLDALWVATTSKTTDDPLAALCDRLDVQVHRGDEHDVLARFLGAARLAEADVLVRLTADCPMSDPALIDEVVSVYAQGDVDYVSNVLVRTYPDGLDVEVFSRAALEEATEKATQPFHREHVTPWLQTGFRPELPTGRFRLRHVVNDVDLGEMRWTVDQAEDLDLIRRLFAALPDGFGWRDALVLVSADPELARRSRLPERYVRAAS